eukprot:TRINITY_DN13723_c0_g1_i1.p1 TRINITY_DN13723_c0_g1~~TRINITY_DN13723_c0_g1_i1.p1  ORF type:complete len:84 (-),score=6.43 TRINITY_DN13723_c0_g1_i1:194-445(-)
MKLHRHDVGKLSSVMPNLEELTLRVCAYSIVEQFVSLTRFRHLRYLHVSRFHDLETLGSLHFNRTFPSLKTLEAVKFWFGAQK